jgi:hypothetical protein
MELQESITNVSLLKKLPSVSNLLENIKNYNETHLDNDCVVYNKGNIIDCEEIPITHAFADQVYLRQMNMSKDQIVVGAVHNHKHIWFLMTGKVSIRTEDEIITHVAPCYTVSEPGEQRVICAHEDSIFINIHKNPTNNKNIQELEKEIVSLTKKEYEQKNK